MSDEAAQRHARLSGILVAAMRLPEAERASHVKEACAGDVELEAKILALIARDAEVPLELHPTGAVRDLAAGDVVASRASSEVPGCRLVRVIGEGGMGTVYEAEQDQPRRRLAIKVIRGLSVTPDALRRFAREANILGSLQHPGICQVHEVGRTAAGDPYIAMELVEGRSLLEHAREANLDRAGRVALAMRICDAVAHAHERGIVHRDLKSDNILITQDGRPKVLDFGVAHAARETGGVTMLTNTGAVVGTTSTMSPEQAAGEREVTSRSDVYSLGALFFELLTGRRALDLSGLTLPQALHVIQRADLSLSSTTPPDLRGDLATILGKALARDPERRYADARELGDDIRRHLDHEPIVARPPSIAYRVVKFTHRNRPFVLATCAVVLALTAGLAIAFVQWRRATERAVAAETEAYRATMVTVATAIDAGDPQRAAEELARVPAQRRGWEAQQLQAVLDVEFGRAIGFAPATGIDISADGRSAFTSRLDGEASEVVQVSLPDGELLDRYPVSARPLVVPEAGLRTAIGALIALHPEGVDLDVVDPSTGAIVRHVRTCPGAHANLDGPRLPEVVLPRGVSLILQVDGALHFCDLASGEIFGSPVAAMTPTHWLTPDGTTYLESGNARARTSDVSDGRETWTTPKGTDGASAAALSPNGRFVYTSGMITDPMLRKWSLATGGIVAERKLGGAIGFDSWAFTPDGRRVVVATRAELHVFDGDLETQLARRSFPAGAIRWPLAITPDGRLVVTAGGRDGLRIYDLAVPNSRLRLEGHETYVYSVAFSPDGRRLASCSWDGTVRASDAATGAPLRTRRFDGDRRHQRVLFSRDGRRLYSLTTRPLRVLDPETLDELHAAIMPPWPLSIIELPSRDRLLLTTERSARILDAGTLDEIATPAGISGVAALGADGTVAISSLDGNLVACDGRDMRERWRRSGAPLAAGAWKDVAFSPDGTLLAVTTHHHLDVLDARTGAPRVSVDHDAPLTCVVWTHDGKRLVIGETSGSIAFLDAATGQRITSFSGHSAYVRALAFSPDGRTLASASGDGDVRLWRVGAEAHVTK